MRRSELPQFTLANEGFKFVQIKGLTFFQGVKVMKQRKYIDEI